MDYRMIINASTKLEKWYIFIIIFAILVIISSVVGVLTIDPFNKDHSIVMCENLFIISLSALLLFLVLIPKDITRKKMSFEFTNNNTIVVNVEDLKEEFDLSDLIVIKNDNKLVFKNEDFVRKYKLISTHEVEETYDVLKQFLN